MIVMGKIIRPTYPANLSIGVLLLIFSIAFFLSHMVFDIHAMPERENVYFGMFLVSSAVIIMVLVLWEEFLFPIKIKPVPGGFIFRNHRAKFNKQLLIYLAIPAIFCFIFLDYKLNYIRFFIWAGICVLVPLADKLISGINNYNDYLQLTTNAIEYKNNEKTGNFGVGDIRAITLIKDERKVLHKIQLTLTNGNEVLIDLDEMELDGFMLAIGNFTTTQYKELVTERPV